MNDEQISEIERKKRFLKRYRKNTACIMRLEEKLKTLDGRIKAIRSPNYSGMPRGGQPVTIDDLLADKDEIERRIERLRAKGKDLRAEILDEIDSLDDVRYCDILEEFFIGCKSLDDIADDGGYSVRHVYRLYSEAVTRLALNRQ